MCPLQTTAVITISSLDRKTGCFNYWVRPVHAARLMPRAPRSRHAPGGRWLARLLKFPCSSPLRVQEDFMDVKQIVEGWRSEWG